MALVGLDVHAAQTQVAILRFEYQPDTGIDS
jgi:hypothetical protein